RLGNDDRGESPGVDDLPTEKRPDDEDGRPDSAYPTVLEPRGGIPWLRDAQRECIGQRRGGCERRSMEEARHEQRREAGGGQQAKRHECGKQLASREDSAKRLGTVGEAPTQRPGDEPDRRTRGEQYPELLGRETSSFEEGRHEWRGDAERGVHQCVENSKT